MEYAKIQMRQHQTNKGNCLHKTFINVQNICIVNVSYFSCKLGEGLPAYLPAAMLYKIVCQLEDVKINNSISNDANEHLT